MFDLDNSSIRATFPGENPLAIMRTTAFILSPHNEFMEFNPDSPSLPNGLTHSRHIITLDENASSNEWSSNMDRSHDVDQRRFIPRGKMYDIPIHRLIKPERKQCEEIITPLAESVHYDVLNITNETARYNKQIKSALLSDVSFPTRP